MRKLTDDITDEPHCTDAETMWYTTIQREFMGRTLTIEVEVYLMFDGGPAEMRYYGRTPFYQYLGEGFAVAPDAFIMLSDDEKEDLLDGPEASDYLSAEADADDHQKDSEHYFATTR